MKGETALAPMNPDWQVTPEQLIEFDPQWAVFWGDSIAASQLELWLPYLRRSRYRYVLVSSVDQVNKNVPPLLEGLSNVIVAFPYETVRPTLRKHRRFRGVIYPTTRSANFAMVTALPLRSHVWVGHGESEKGVNGPRTASLYDAVFMARYSALARFPPGIRPWVRSGACAIGAPIVEGAVKSPWPGPRKVKTILYAPTWEGRAERMDLSSLPEVVPILRDLMPTLRERGVTVIVRPHPGTGQRDHRHRALVDELFAAGASPSGGKAKDFAAADVMLSDISGVSAEFLFTEKPAIMPVTKNATARGRDAAILAGEYPWTYQWEVADRDFLGMLDGLAASDPLRGKRASLAREMYRGHRDIEDAVRTFDIALSCAHRRESLFGVRLAFEAKVRNPLGRGFLRRPRRRRRWRRHSAAR